MSFFPNRELEPVCIVVSAKKTSLFSTVTDFYKRASNLPPKICPFCIHMFVNVISKAHTRTVYRGRLVAPHLNRALYCHPSVI